MRAIIFALLLALGSWLCATAAHAEGNLDINTPAISQFKTRMAERHPQLLPWYQAGALGLAKDGTVVLHNADAVPLAQRQALNRLLAAENSDRAGLYREIARANGNPGWETDIRATFAQRWVEHAPRGWWVQNTTGAWQQKQ